MILCGRQNLPLRGHRDDARYHDEKSNNAGNFVEVVKYGARCAAGHSKQSGQQQCPVPKNATYISKTTQNQLIELCGEYLTEAIVAEIKEAKFFSILAKEATDCSDIEQMSFVADLGTKSQSSGKNF